MAVDPFMPFGNLGHASRGSARKGNLLREVPNCPEQRVALGSRRVLRLKNFEFWINLGLHI